VFRELYGAYEPGARALAADLDVIPDEDAARG
jgi:hypothetical protein